MELPDAAQFLSNVRDTQSTRTLPPHVADRIKDHLYRRACSHVVSFFSRSAERLSGGVAQTAVMRDHVAERLPEFLAWVQSKGYDVEVGDSTVIVRAPAPA
jgi:type III secretory pathway component EscR